MNKHKHRSTGAYKNRIVPFGQAIWEYNRSTGNPSGWTKSSFTTVSLFKFIFYNKRKHHSITKWQLKNDYLAPLYTAEEEPHSPGYVSSMAAVTVTLCRPNSVLYTTKWWTKLACDGMHSWTELSLAFSSPTIRIVSDRPKVSRTGSAWFA